jgi:hypothetical protein
MGLVTHNEVRPEDLGETPVIEVRAYRHGELLERRLFESEDEVEAFVASLRDQVDIEVEVDDLSVHHGPRDVLEPALGEELTEEYAEAGELERDEPG